ncbi:MAG: hypothetical protein JW863_02220 [Chitinispirillaceae bacterium]|nr:hypothetical protein [Chitinispirillaceae bacterium]
MKNSMPLFLVSGMLVTAFAQTTPVTQFGSNPWFSSELYPQDLLLRSGNYLFYSPQYFNRPFWGDIDEPEKRPNTNTDYTITGVDVVRDGGSFKHSGVVHTINNNIGYTWQPGDNMAASLAWDYDVDARRNRAEGVFTADTPSYPLDATLPFEYSMRHTIYRASLIGMLGTVFRSVPLGIRFDGGVENTLALKKDLTFSKLAKNPDGTFSETMEEYAMSEDEARAMWGWTEPGCSHPFGARGTQGDSWLQNEYATGPIYHLNLIGGVTLPRIKAGGYFRYKWGHQDRYYWESSGEIVGNDSIISNNFIGRYVRDDQTRIIRTGEGRVFGNLRLHGNERFSLSAFGMLTYEDSTLGSAAADNLRAESSSKDRIRTIALEADPNISVKLGEGLNYIDAALLCRYQYSRFGNVSDQWVGGGEITAYQSSSVGEGWQDVWEHFSYANQNVFDLGADISAMFPVLSHGIHHLSFNLRMFGDLRFSYQRKYFGSNTVSGSDVDFTVENTRLNLAREVMFNTFLMLQYVQGPYQLRLQFTKPVLYSIAPYTSIFDANGSVVDDENNYPLKRSDLWITREGMSVALFGSYDITLPFLRSR